MKKLTVVVVFLLLVGTALAEDFSEAQSIISAKTPCDQLSQDQLEQIGDYYMEQMHPGAAHERMDDMMGGEGSASLRAMHIQMAQSFYCGNSSAVNSGMMNWMADGNNYGMMGGGMMGGNYRNMMYYDDDYGKHDGWSLFGSWLANLVYVALAAFIFGVVFWWTKRLVVKEKKRR